MKENKIAKIPVASHGLHKHSYNYPWLSSINFCDVMPCYINTVRKGEHDHPKAGMFSQLMPIAHNAFATGRFNFKAIFVPYKLVWRPWYSFDQQTEFISNGQASTPNHYPFIYMGDLSAAFVSSLCSAGSQSQTDLIYRDGSNDIRYIVTDTGRRVLRILMALGCTPSWIKGDKNKLNILPILCYLKAYADYYFPQNYVGNSYYNSIARFQERDTIDFSSEASTILTAIEYCSKLFYDNSVFDNAWDSPTMPNALTLNPEIDIKDPTFTAGDTYSAGNDQNNIYVTNGEVSHTPIATGTVENTSGYNVLGFTQYIVEALKSVSMWCKRHQFTGARLIDRFLVSRGISLSDDSARQSYFLGQINYEIEVSGVENNTDTNLGELAGRGVSSSGSKPLSFDCKADDDGIFLVIVSAVPDADFPVYLDGFSCREDYMDNYNAEFDKLGSAAIPSRVVCQNLNGSYNQTHKDGVFGYVNQYWDEVQERPRLLGDFVLPTQGSVELSAYHTFRLLPVSLAPHHSYDFIRTFDSGQYQRLFYNSKQENLMLFLRWRGDQYKEKLPLGDSYNWDDDELNKKVSVVLGGSQK